MGSPKFKGGRPDSAPELPDNRRQTSAVSRPEAENEWRHSDANPEVETFFPPPHLVPLAARAGEAQLRVLVVDDQLLVRAGICQLVKAIPNVTVVGEASDGSEALRLIGKHDPDIVLMDIAMPGMNGLEALVLARRKYPHVRVIMLSEHVKEEFVFRALRAGAAGFIAKEDTVAEFYTAIKEVAEGGWHLKPTVLGKDFLGDDQNQPVAGELARGLTPRQRVVLRHMAEGKSTKEIASLLGISVNTAKTHRLKLMEKLGVHEISAVVRYAAKLGLINN